MDSGDNVQAQTNQARLTRYAATGCIHPIDVMSRAEAADSRARLEAAEQRCRAIGAEFPYTKPYLALSVANELARLPVVLDLVEAIIGPDILVWDAAFLIKEPHHEARFTWHQDLTYWGLTPKESVVSTWLALSPSTPESGCMKIIPGSHAQDILPHHDTFGADNMLSRGQVLAVEVDESQAVDLVLEPGQMSIHHPHLFHGSAPNRSDDRRIGLNVQYIAPYVKQVVGAWDSAMLVRGVDREGNFEAEPPPEWDLAPEGLARWAEINQRRRDYLFRETGDTAVDGRRPSG